MVHHKKQTGFALLMTLIVVSVLISIGLVVLDLSIKQIKLSTNAKESETAFHASNAGMECARYMRRIASTSMEAGGTITPTCFSASATTNTKATILSNANGNVYKYTYSFDWGTKPRCSVLTTLVMNANGTSNLILSNVATHIPGYPSTGDKICAPGERCTIIASLGYNRSCSTAGGYGSVEREQLVQF